MRETAQAGGSWPRLAKAFRLGLLVTAGGARAGRFRSVRTSGLLLALSAIGSVLLVTHVGAGDVADVVALRLLAYAAWLYGLLGLPALLDPKLRWASAEHLARLRGVQSTPAPARALGLSVRLTGGMYLAALPGVVAAAATSHTLTTLGLRAALLALSAGYLLLLAAGLGVLGALAEQLAPKRPRRVALAMVLLPFALSWIHPNIPSLPGAFIWAFSELVLFGGLSA